MTALIVVDHPEEWPLTFAAAEVIARVTSPLLVIAGERDAIVPLDQSRRLFDAARERGCRVTAVTISARQHEWAVARMSSCPSTSSTYGIRGSGTTSAPVVRGEDRYSRPGALWRHAGGPGYGWGPGRARAPTTEPTRERPARHRPHELGVVDLPGEVGMVLVVVGPADVRRVGVGEDHVQQ